MNTKGPVGVVEFGGKSLGEKPDPAILFENLRVEPEVPDESVRSVSVFSGDVLLVKLGVYRGPGTGCWTVDSVSPENASIPDISLALNFLLYKNWAHTFRSIETISEQIFAPFWPEIKSLLPTRIFRFRFESKGEPNISKIWAISTSADRLTRSFEELSKYNLIRIS